MNKDLKFELVDRLNGVIDQAKFIRNILVHNDTAETNHVKQYVIELKDMTNSLKTE